METKNVRKSYETKLVQGQVLNRLFYREKDLIETPKVKVIDLPKGTSIKTGGGKTGIITGRKTRTAIQIQLVDRETEFDWIAKEALVNI